jgi:hypothetical protein
MMTSSGIVAWAGTPMKGATGVLKKEKGQMNENSK